MLTRDHAFLVIGDPLPKGSMKCIGARGKVKHQLIESTDTSKWRAIIEAGARQWIDEQADKHQPVLIFITYSLRRPASHYGTGRNSTVLKPSAPVFPCVHGSGDVDKLTRAVLDALQDAGVLDNDAQVVDAPDKKRYARDRTDGGLITPDHRDILPVPGVVIRLHPLGDDDV